MKKFKKITALTLCISMLMLSGCAYGMVTDEETGKPIVGAKGTFYETNGSELYEFTTVEIDGDNTYSYLLPEDGNPNDYEELRDGASYTVDINEGIYGGIAYYGATAESSDTHVMELTDDPITVTAIQIDIEMMRVGFSIDLPSDSVEPGKSVKLATTDKKSKAAHPVTWSISGNNSTSTKITQNGTLTVGSDETALNINIKANSTAFSTVSSDATIKVLPKAKVNEYKVKFYNGKKLIKTKTIKEGKKVGKLPKATKKGMILKGWYTKSNKKISKNTKLTKNLKVYAKYKANGKIRNCNYVHLRAGNTKYAKKIGVIKKGTAVKVYKKTKNHWYKVSYKGKIGYIDYRYVKKAK